MSLHDRDDGTAMASKHNPLYVSSLQKSSRVALLASFSRLASVKEQRPNPRTSAFHALDCRCIFVLLFVVLLYLHLTVLVIYRNRTQSTFVPSYSAAVANVRFSERPSSSDSPSIPENLHRLARFADRLHRGLPVIVAAIGGSNMAGVALHESRGGKGMNGSLVNLVVDWMNEKFPVNKQAALDEFNQMSSKWRIEAASLDALNTTIGEECLPNSTSVLSHQAYNRAVGGTRSSMASFCLQRLLPCAHVRAPDLLLIDFAVNDFLPDDDVSSFTPSINMERLVRQLLFSMPNTSIIFTHFAFDQFMAMMNAEHSYKSVALHYHVPEISIRRFSEEFLWQKEHYAEVEGWVKLPDPQLRLLSDRIPLPLPTWLHEHGMNFSQVLYENAYHMNDAGHRLLASLTNQQILRWILNLKHSNWTSLVDPLYFTPTIDPIQYLSRPSTALPQPLSTVLNTADSAPFRCYVLYAPYNPTASSMSLSQAEAFLGVTQNFGFHYGSMASSQKFAFKLDESEWSQLGQSMIIRLKRPVHSMTLAYVRSWNASMMGDMEAWLSCDETQSSTQGRSTPKILLSGVWKEANTQADSMQLWPTLDEQQQTTQAWNGNCDLRWLHIKHVASGDVRLIGFMLN